MDALQSSPQGFTGTVNLQLTDLFQMVCLCRSDLVIRVRSGETGGTIYVRDGQVCHAQTELLQGEAAFFQMFQWKDGQFEMVPYVDPGISTIDKPWEHLLLEAMRQKDEAGEGDPAEKPPCGPEDCQSDGAEQWEMNQKIDLVFDELEEISRGFSSLQEEPLLEPERGEPTRVLIVDDSAFFAKQLKRLMESDSNIQVAAMAKNGKEAVDYLAKDPHVDLITLDVQMPVMKGDTALKHIMIRYPIPVLIISTFETESVRKIVEFLHLGAIDFLSKPRADEDVTRYGETLRDLVARASRADVSRFRRWRSPKSLPEGFSEPREQEKRLLVILGAEGAYIDWFRLPLPIMAPKGLVVGLQKLSDPFLTGFCELIEEGTRAETEQLKLSGTIGPGAFHFGNGSFQVDLSLNLESMSLSVKCSSEKSLTWSEGAQLWLSQLAEQACARMSVYLLSGAQSLPQALIEKLLSAGSQLIMSPRATAMCTELIDSVQAYALSYPQQIKWASHENLMEVWLQNEVQLQS
jgi:two-component system chemotaxis response regulator CheB